MPTLNTDATSALVDWAQDAAQEASTDFERTSRLVKRLGAHVTARSDDPETGDSATFGFWVPELSRFEAAPGEAVLEILTPPPNLDLTEPPAAATFRRDTLPMMPGPDDTLWAAVDGLRAGSRDTVGVFYQVRLPAPDGSWRRVPDYLAASVPFGAFAPAELYDAEQMQAERADADYFASLDTGRTRNDLPHGTPPAHILQVHPGTSSDTGSLAGLTRTFQRIADKIEAGEPLTPEEETYAGYEAVQLMPVEPIIEYEAGPDFWSEKGNFAPGPEAVTVDLRRPDVTNWGYDIPISASSAVNPVILETKRPDELVDLAATLHTFPTGPIQLIFDVVYGHVDNQALGLLADEFFAGPGMYGMNLDYQNPMVRSLLLEMQRRKINFGADGVRTDGAQDFKYWDPETQQLYHDDAYLQQMSDLVQEVAGTKYYPWMIFEDGRPWPQDDWELSSTYRAVIDQQPDVFQWGPLTFAHNTPFLFTYWISRWWRIQEVAHVGGHWISGCANHDTLRRGAQVDPTERINTFLGDALPEIIEQAYDNPAATLLTYGIFPGVPMDFLHAFLRVPWSFIRNTDDRYGVKVASEEARFLDWRVTVEQWNRPEHFSRLKALGFDTYEGLHRFMHALDHAVQLTDYELEAIPGILGAMRPALQGPELSVDALKTVARAWMDDVHDYCTVTHHTGTVDAGRAAFNRALRDFRSEHDWLRHSFSDKDVLRYRDPAEGTIVFGAMRTAPGGDARVLFAANMEGAPAEVTPTDLVPEAQGFDWRPAVSAPDVDVDPADATAADAPITLPNARGVLFTA